MDQPVSHKKYFSKRILYATNRSTKTGIRTENRTSDQPEIFMDELVPGEPSKSVHFYYLHRSVQIYLAHPVRQYKFACIGIFRIGPTMFKRQ